MRRIKALETAIRRYSLYEALKSRVLGNFSKLPARPDSGGYRKPVLREIAVRLERLHVGATYFSDKCSLQFRTALVR